MSIGTGVFVSFEGGEGAGKSTQIRLLAETLRHRGHEVLLTREPGGSRGAEAVRHVLLSGAAEEFGTRMEAILFAAARSDHIDHVIRPALMKGRIVLCDRFIDSSRVYQGATGNLDRDFIEALVRVAINGVMPDRTIMVDVPASIGLERARRRGAAAAAPDRFEKESLQMHEKRREAFLDIAAAEPDRCRVVDGTKPEMLLAQDILGIVEPLLSRKHAYPASARERER